jgi:hypothetical protein
MGLLVFRRTLFCLFVALAGLPTRADDILFFGNSFTFAEMAPAVKKNGGVPKLVEAIATAKGKKVATEAVIAGGKDLGFHLAQPKTATALRSKVWNWVVLQDYSTQPTSAGHIDQFLKNGETFSDRIAVNSPKAGIVLYETWARPAGAFYQKPPGNVFTGGPDQMMSELHTSYAKLKDALAAKNPNRPALVAPVGTAFALSKATYPEIILDASDSHHATAEGYYLAALVIYETIYRDSAKGAPAQFFDGAQIFPPEVAAKLQDIADKVCAAKK